MWCSLWVTSYHQFVNNVVCRTLLICNNRSNQIPKREMNFQVNLNSFELYESTGHLNWRQFNVNYWFNSRLWYSLTDTWEKNVQLERNTHIRDRKQQAGVRFEIDFEIVLFFPYFCLNVQHFISQDESFQWSQWINLWTRGSQNLPPKFGVVYSALSPEETKRQSCLERKEVVFLPLQHAQRRWRCWQCTIYLKLLRYVFQLLFINSAIKFI